MRQVSLRDFRIQGSRALGKLEVNEVVVLTNRQGPAYFVIPVEADAMEAQEDELRTAMALAAMRESWKRAEVSGLSRMTMKEIDAEIDAYRAERKTGKKRVSR